jgi:hypothetical protein
MDNQEMIDHVKDSVNPKIQNWVLFANGTFVLFKKIESNEDLAEMAIEHIKKFGPAHGGSVSGDFATINLEKNKGWLVTGWSDIMYTFVHPMELENKNPSSFEIGFHGREKRHQDSQELRIIHINTA